jgi:uncharacterized membrane protein
MSRTLDARLGYVLGVGVAASTVLLAFGLVLGMFLPGPAPQWLLHAGLVLLMVTPVTRVIVAAWEFVHLREWFFALASLGVLSVLAMGVWVAVRGG